MSEERPEELSYDDEDIQRDLDWQDFIDEISNDSDRGVVLALAARVEFAAKTVVAKLLGVPPTDHGMTMGNVITRLQRLHIVSSRTFGLLDALSKLRNRAAHSPRRFSLLDQQPHQDGNTNQQLVTKLVSPLKHHIARVRLDPQWQVHGSGPIEDFKIVVRLLWASLDRLHMNLPLPRPSQNPFDLQDTDPETFCIATLDEMRAAGEADS